MRKATAAIAAATLLTSGSTALSAQAAALAHGPDPVADYIVVLEDGAAARTADLQAARYDAEVTHVYRDALRGYAARMSVASAEALRHDDGVAFVQPDRAVATAEQAMPVGINRTDADLSPTARINGTDERVDVDVAVIDTGVDLDHPDLNVYAAGAHSCSAAGSPDDANGHGTHVSGTIGALDDANGVVGVAPGARIWPVRVLDDQGSGSFADVICGLDYVTAHADEIEVANLSLGGVGEDDGDCGATNDDAMHAAICRSVAAGVTVVAAAGNASGDAANVVPAAYDEVITVSALAEFDGVPGGTGSATCMADEDDSFAWFSNYGADIDLAAPGVCVDSTWANGGYATVSGTSMASPHVAGGAALYAAINPTATPDQVKAALQAAGATDWNASDDPDGTHEPLLDVATY